MKVSRVERRLDLQGIRGIAILSVLGFHFLPNCFPNGYVGVDQFFVLSGFLMCMLLQKSYSNPNFTSVPKWIFAFYIRRLKRIVPLYFLSISMALLAVLTVFPYTAVDSNISSGKKALIFMSNRMETEDEDYFKALSIAIDIFTHTWSLSVEVQFYLLVPFLYIIGAKLGDIRNKLGLLYFVGLGTLSYVYSTIFCSETEAFNSVRARIWQFCVGIIAYLFLNLKTACSQGDQKNCSSILEIGLQKPSKSSPSPIFKTFLTIGMILCSVFPFEFSSQSCLFRFMITIFTGILMILPSDKPDLILESRGLTYFGDISYSLYLIHWPIYAYWKLMLSHGQTWNSELILALGFSILLAVLSYELFEKWYLKRSDAIVLLFSTAIFILNLGLLYQTDISNLISPPETSSRLDGLQNGEVVSYYKASKLNRLWSTSDLANLGAPTCVYESENKNLGFCKHTHLDAKNGKFKLMLIGNSWAANHATLFYEECGYQAKSIIQESLASCEPLHLWALRPICLTYMENFVRKVEEEKPDYLFIFARFMDVGNPMPLNITDLNDDPIYQSMKRRLKMLIPHVKRKVFVMNQVARFNNLIETDSAQVVLEKKDLIEFDNSLVSFHPEMARLRYEKLVSECPRCVLFDYKPYFFNETTQTWRFYDEANAGLSYMTKGNHLSYHGLELVRPVIKYICSSL